MACCFVVASFAVAAAAHTDVAAVVFVEIVVAGFAFYFVVVVSFTSRQTLTAKKIKLQPK